MKAAKQDLTETDNEQTQNRKKKQTRRPEKTK
jgi:hypothetical protein